MKRLYAILLVAVCIAINAFSQVPEKMSYQAVVRNSSNQLVISQAIGMKISILQGTSSGTIIYQETYNPNPQTNANGLVSIEIGGGIPITGTFSAINWANGPYFLKTETDPTGGTSYTITGTSQLLSVPYALYAKTAENGFSGSYDDLTDTPTLFSGNYSDLTDKPSLFDGSWANLTGKPTTLTGYGITDAVTTSGNQTIAGNKTFTGTINASNKVISSVATPVSTTDAVNKAYVDEIKETIYNELLDAGMNGFVKDIEGNTYKTIKIGTQVWMAENLAYLPAVSPPSSESSTSPYYYVYGYEGTSLISAKATSNYTSYGVLYNWPAAMAGAASSSSNPSGVQGVCPSGWHLPSDAEWTELTDFLGGEGVAGGKLKEVGYDHWYSPNTAATNESGFTALPGGSRDNNGTFLNVGSTGWCWSATEAGATVALTPSMDYNYAYVSRHGNFKEVGFSVRCVRDY